MIKGMSYSDGVFFMNKKGVSHATFKNGRVQTYYERFTFKAIAYMLFRLITTMPLYLYSIFLLLIFLTPPIPMYVLIVVVFGYHFMFPRQLKKYHGAEHKVFSYKGRRHLAYLQQIEQASIVNRYCSTNAIVIFFFFFLLIFPFVNGWIAVMFGIVAMNIIPKVWKWGEEHIFFPVSAYLQKKVTTAQPDEQHLRVAILSYMSLIAERPLSEEEVWESYQKEIEAMRQIEETSTAEQSNIDISLEHI